MLSLKILIMAEFMKYIVCIDQLLLSFDLSAFIISELTALDALDL